MFLWLLLASVPECAGHGQLTYPPSRHNAYGRHGDCGGDGPCYWFSNGVEIAGQQTLNAEDRSGHFEWSGQDDLYKTFPWRAPGTAPVIGSGCGSAGGGPVVYANGGTAPPHVPQGLDGIQLPQRRPTVWSQGAEVEVAWAIQANHGGGYAYRLCKDEGQVTEECFQQGHLAFAGDNSWLLYRDGSKSAGFKAKTVSSATHPEGSQWRRNPIPSCRMCEDLHATCGDWLPPVSGEYWKTPWNWQQSCIATCEGSAASRYTGTCPTDRAAFEEPLPGISGYGKSAWDWSVMDKVKIPSDLEPGRYLLSWRWDCESSNQVWQNCADIEIVAGDAPEAPPYIREGSPWTPLDFWVNPDTGRPWTKADFHQDTAVNPETGQPWTKNDFHQDVSNGTINPDTGRPWTKGDFHQDVSNATINPDTGRPWTKGDFHHNVSNASINPDTGRPWTKGDFHHNVSNATINPDTGRPWTKDDFHHTVSNATINPDTGRPWTKDDFHKDNGPTPEPEPQINPDTGRPWTKGDFHEDIHQVDICFDAYGGSKARCLMAGPRCRWYEGICLEVVAVDICMDAYGSNLTRCAAAGTKCNWDAVRGVCSDSLPKRHISSQGEFSSLARSRACNSWATALFVSVAITLSV